MYLTSTDPALNNTLNYFDVVAAAPGMLIVKILDIHGRIAKTIKEKVEQGANKLSVNLSDLKKGSYVLNVFNDDTFIKAVRFMKI